MICAVSAAVMICIVVLCVAVQICVAERRGYVLRNTSLGDFVVVRTCTNTNLDSLAYNTPRVYCMAYFPSAANLYSLLLY